VFDREYAAAVIGDLDARRRGQVATACLVRVAGLLGDARMAEEFPGVATLVQEIRDYAIGRAEGREAAPPAAVERGIRDFLGPRDDPFEELPGRGAWAMDIASLADYVLRTWDAPQQSAHNCFNALLASYSLAAFLEDESEAPEASGLADGEFRRQMADASFADGGWADVIEGSRTLARVYPRCFQRVQEL
jgi:hypothetical protein